MFQQLKKKMGHLHAYSASLSIHSASAMPTEQPQPQFLLFLSKLFGFDSVITRKEPNQF